MDFYPQDLLVGFHPLVFCVNACNDEKLFKHFLDAIAAVLVDETNESGAEPPHKRSLFRQDDDDSSSDDDDEEDAAVVKRRTSGSSFLTGRTRSSTTTTNSGGVASYAKALTQGQGFFQRARIQAVSVKHGLPPFGSRQKKKDAFKKPVEGILPAGWLEKHVHALPSVILIVCSVEGNHRQDRMIMDTIKHFLSSIAPKRNCKIHVIGIMQKESQGETWSRMITSEVEDDVTVSLLKASVDLQESLGVPTTLAFRKMHQQVRDDSMMYYLTQARRVKSKLAELKKATSSPYMLPLLIRYCFKIAIFYEFQWKHQKSLRFFVEGYRHVKVYHEFLLSLRSGKTATSQRPTYQAVAAESGDSFEVALHDDNKKAHNDVQPIPNDMVYQCRAVAEWINLKLLLAGFSSHTEGGLLAAANQWRQHCRIFCTTSPTIARPVEQEEDGWFECAYIARQWLVVSELVERHPPKALGDLGNDYDEVLLRCSPWRTYEAAVEATLRLAREIDKARKKHENTSSTTADKSEFADEHDPMRGRYVGSLDSEGLLPMLQELYRVDYRARALELTLRAISLYEREMEREKRGFWAEDHFSEKCSSRGGARLYYLAGGILLGMRRHKDAAGHLEKASKYTRGWRRLELAVRKLLIECYEKHLPSSTEASEESNQAIASMILDSYFNANMSPRDLRRALGHFASISGGASLKWYHEAVDDEEASLPFSFAVSFPGKTHATAGDVVQASVSITSNLDYAVHVNSVVLQTLAGPIAIPSVDLFSAANASEGSGGIIIQSKTSIIISTEIELPKDLSVIAIDESGNGGEAQGVAGKGSFAKSARPRTAGVTAAGGARLIVEEEDSTPGNAASQGWSLHFLGGKPLRCDGLQLVFYPVQAEKAAGGAETTTLIELTMRKKKPKTAANIKRTPFEEENYVASAWSRPAHLHLSMGPRSLRVLGPMPELVIQNMTEPLTGGSVLEGTVNRILLKLTPGLRERCHDVKYKVSCFSVLITPSGSTRRLVSEEEITAENEGSVNMKVPNHRTPSLVRLSSDSQTSVSTDLGYDLPNGWELAGSGQEFEGPPLKQLHGGERKFIELSLYRPPPLVQNVEAATTTEDEDTIADISMCKTDVYVTVTYRQERAPMQKAKRGSVNRARRRRPVKAVAPTSEGMEEGLSGEFSPEDKGGKEEEESLPEVAEVSLEYTGSVIWGQALSATFRPGAKQSFPSGSRASSNAIDPTAVGDNGYLSVSEGEQVTTRCSLQTESGVKGLNAEILAIRFEEDDSEAAKVGFSLLTDVGDNMGKIYFPSKNDPSRTLTPDSRLSVAYAVVPRLRSYSKDSQGVKTNLGRLCVDWKPTSLPLPREALTDTTVFGSILSHGPLRLDTPASIRFSGPACWVESAPFEAKVESAPSAPRTGVPFEVLYSIKNKTNSHQSLAVNVLDPAQWYGADGLLFSGMTHGELNLGPLETQKLSFTALASRSGKAKLPALQVSSNEFKTWVIKETHKDVWILP